MPSSLSTQLAQSASLNSSLLLERTRTRHRHSVQSYLFSGKDAVEHDLDSIYALGRNGFEGLQAIDKNTPWGEYEEALFSHAARRTDRTLLTTEETHKLNLSIEGFLGNLGPHLMSSPASKSLEWLIRKFRINEFNVPSILSLFLPYHETPHFVKILSILKIEAGGPFGFLKAYAEARRGLTRGKLVEEMWREGEVARFVVGLVPTAKVVHRTLVAFNAATLHDFILRSKVIDEGTMAFLLPALFEPLTLKGKGKGKNRDRERERDAVLASYVLLAALSRASERKLAPQALKTIVNAVVGAAVKGGVGVTPRQLVNALVTICEPQNELGDGEGFDEKTVERVVGFEGVVDEFHDALTQGFVGVDKVVHPMLYQLIKRLHTPESSTFLETLILASPPSSRIPGRITSSLLPLVTHSSSVSPENENENDAPDSENQTKTSTTQAATRLLTQLHQRFPGVLRAVTTTPTTPTTPTKEEVDELIMRFENAKFTTSGSKNGKEEVTKAILASTNPDSGVRSRGVKELLSLARECECEGGRGGSSDGGDGGEEEEKEDRDAIHTALLARIQDSHFPVLEALYAPYPNPNPDSEGGPGLIKVILDSERNWRGYVDTLEGAVGSLAGGSGSGEKKAAKEGDKGGTGKGVGRALIKTHLGFVVRWVLPALNTSNSKWGKGQTEELFHRILFPFLLYSKPRGKTVEGVWGILREGILREGNSSEGLSREGAQGQGLRWTAGCADVFGAEQGQGQEGENGGDGGGDEVERMRRLNEGVVERIAANILTSPSVSTDIDTLLLHLRQPTSKATPNPNPLNPHARLLALLVCRALLRRLAHTEMRLELELAGKVVNLVREGLDKVDNKGEDKWGFRMSVGSEEELVEILSPPSLGRLVITKPSNRNTEGVLWVALMRDIAGMGKPKHGGNEEGEVDWIGRETTSPTYTYTYPNLIRSVYALTPIFASAFTHPSNSTAPTNPANPSNSTNSTSPTNTSISISAQVVKIHLFRAIFEGLGNETLLMLAGVWVRHGHGVGQKEKGKEKEKEREREKGLGAMALLHASAFLEAYASADGGGGDGAVDFQIILPALLVGLASKDPEVRRGAGRCVGLIGRISGVGGEGGTKSKVKFGSVYAFDGVYGSGSDKSPPQELQYLSPEDFTAYLGALLECEEHFAYDAEGEYVSAFHEEHLCATGDKDKEKYQGNILCFLLSHVNAITLPSAQAALLKIVEPAVNSSTRSFKASSSPSKSQWKTRAQAPLILLPLLRVFAEKPAKVLLEVYGEYTGEIAALSAGVVFGFGGGVVLLNDEVQKEDVWEVFCRLLKRGLGASQRQNPLATLRQTLSTLLLEKGLWGALKRERKVELCKVILGVGVNEEGAEEVCKTLLGRLLCAGQDAKQKVQVITQVLEYLKTELAMSEGGDTPRASKRVKLDKAQAQSGSREDGEEEEVGSDSPFARLALLAEVLASLATRTSSESLGAGAGAGTLPSSFELISHLLEMLSRIMQWTSSNSTAGAVAGIPMATTSGSGSGSGVGYVGESDVTFVQQNLMAAVEVAASGVKEAPNLAPNAIRLDVLVELIRVTSNPQTFHQALLLIANLARLAPESVLRNIMPVFTFMGSNVFHRDDTYSFAVVQKTVDNIVPVMVASLKQTHAAGGLEMYIGARDFLRVFTDAANHIPRHRRTNFFAHLVDVLGPKEFLTPICLLLVEKSANKIIRSQNQSQGQGKDKDGLKDDLQGALGLPTMLVHHYPYELQVWVLAEMLRESERLARRVTDPENTAPTFLDDSLLEEHSISPSTTYRRRSQAIIAFVGHAAKIAPPSATESESGRLSDALTLLISLSTMNSGDNAASKIDDIVRTARTSMRRVLNVMAARDFVDAVLSMISSEDKMIQEGALDLLSIRLPNVPNNVRQAVTPSIIKILEPIGKLLSKQPSRSLAVTALNSVKSIGNTLCPGEENAVTNLVPTIIGLTRVRDVVAAAISALVPLPTKLGPRLIPHFREIVSQAIVLLREGQETIVAETVNVLLGLLTSIPTFWGKTELSQVIKLFLDLSASVARVPDEVGRLVKTVAKRVPAKVLLPTMCEAWRPLELSPNMGNLVGYFDLLKRALRSSDRPAVQENLRTLFNIFLSAFGIVKGTSPNLEDPKAHAIAAFVELVVKLNEPTFRPLFRRLYDWAFASDNDVETKIMFCGIYIGLLDFFKALMNPYMSMLLTPLIDTLKGFAAVESVNDSLLVAVLETFNKSLSCDDGSFWRDEKIRQLTPSLIAQVPICVQSNAVESKTLLQDCLIAAAEIATDDGILKSMNLDILMFSRSEEARTRLFALSCSEALWRAHGGKLLGFVAETATFIAECCEDENDMVARESFKLKDAAESVAGSINGL